MILVLKDRWKEGRISWAVGKRLVIIKYSSSSISDSTEQYETKYIYGTANCSVCLEEWHIELVAEVEKSTGSNILLAMPLNLDFSLKVILHQ
jgi:hypothetical protein